MRVLVTGSRGWSDTHAIFSALDAIHREHGIELLMEGCARGADRIAEQWAKAKHVPIRHFPADWQRYGLAAGTNRNLLMLDQGRPDLVLAFPLPSSKGTHHMMKIAHAAGITVIDHGYHFEATP